MKKVPVVFAIMAAIWSPLEARAEAHALLLAISAYQAGIPQLKGVSHDIDSAKSIARKLGVRDVNMQVYRDQQLTLAGLRSV
jgi:hypothetical protein